MATIKFPRVVVSVKRHGALAAEAKKLSRGGKKVTIAELAEAKFAKAK